MTTPDALTPPSSTVSTTRPGAPHRALRSGNGPSGLTYSPILVVVLIIVTLGVYGIVWHYMANRELRDFHPSIEVEPWLAAVSLVVPFANLVSIYRTGQRIQQAQVLAGLPPTCTPLVGAVLGWFVVGHAVYYQHALNGVWKHRML